MKLWRKNKKVDRELPSCVTTGLIRLNMKLIAIANLLQRKTNGYSTNKKKVLLLLFVTFFITESVVVAVQSIKEGNKKVITVTRIKTLPVQKAEYAVPVITKSEFLRIQGFKQYIDSLSSTTRGRKLRDSLLSDRPQLMDSVNFLINLYLEQLKTNQK